MPADRSACASCAPTSTSSRATDTSAPERDAGPGAPTGGLGILGGTFNPPHRGHLALAAHARAALGLERVLLMPAHASPHKGSDPDPGPLHRLRMCELAAAGEPGVEACALEIERRGVSYTVDTLTDIKARQPQAQLTFIVGADVATGLPSWRQPEEIVRLARLAVMTRAGADRAAANAALARVFDGPGGGGHPGASFLDMPAVDVSSSMVRARVGAGEAVDGLVPAPVAAYIAEHGLYRAANARVPAGGAGGGGR